MCVCIGGQQVQPQLLSRRRSGLNCGDTAAESNSIRQRGPRSDPRRGCIKSNECAQ